MRCTPSTIDSVSTWKGIFLESARLECLTCRRAYPVVRGIPWFVSSDNYASSFGLEWTEHATSTVRQLTRD